MGLGAFRERTFTLGGTIYRLAVQAGSPPAEEEQVASRLEKATLPVDAVFSTEYGAAVRAGDKGRSTRRITRGSRGGCSWPTPT